MPSIYFPLHDSLRAMVLPIIILAVTGVTPSVGADAEGTEVSTEVIGLPRMDRTTDQDLNDAWGGAAIDAVSNIATKAMVTLEHGELADRSRLENINDGRLVTESFSDDLGNFTLDDSRNSTSFAPDSEIMFSLDGSRDIASIQVITSYKWIRTGQKYDVYTSSDKGESWLKVASVDYPNENQYPALTEKGWQSRRTTITGRGGLLAKGVNALRFYFYGNEPVDEEGEPVSNYSEIAIFEP